MTSGTDIENKLGFDLIRKWIADGCISSLGRDRVNEITFLTEKDAITAELSEAEELLGLIETGIYPPADHYHDLTEYLQRMAPEGTFLEGEEFLEIVLVLETMASWIGLLNTNKERAGTLYATVSSVPFEKAVIKSIRSVIEDDGTVKSNASSDLARVRRSLSKAEKQVRTEFNRIFRDVEKQGYVPADSSVTIRGGRLVIPLMAEHKRRIKGYIHDESSTGHTVFMEPADVIEINNRIRELELEERREVVKVLTALTSEVREHIPSIEQILIVLGRLDMLWSKAKLSRKLGAVRPQIEPGGNFRLEKALHPVLMQKLEEEGREIVPLSVELTNDQRILLISGPNAGGKSVALKTIGILQYMAQCGIMVPTDPDSSFGIYEQIFIDIGDEQSIENDLSTYSSHLEAMKRILNFSDQRSLVLIDEFGTGTDPQYGGAIAQAVLKRLMENKSFALITTHYSNLKKFADESQGIGNASMRFDPEQLEPLYQLETGRPGSSYALEIARKIGLPEDVIREAQDLVGTDQVRYDHLIAQLEDQKTRLSTSQEQLSAREKEYESLTGEIRDQIEKLNSEKEQIIDDAKSKASQLLSEANREIEKTIRHIRENQAQKSETRRVRENLESFKEKVKPVRKKEQKKPVVTGGVLKPGDRAILDDQPGTVCEILQIRGKDAEILLGSLKSTVKLNRLQKISGPVKQKSFKTVTGGVRLDQETVHMGSEIDLRGERANAALARVDQFIDKALLTGKAEIRIVHGKGDGILRSVIREHLMGLPYIEKIVDEHADRGGSGISIVYLK